MNKSSIIKNTEQFKLDDSGSYDSCVADYHQCVNRLCEPFVKQMVAIAHLKQGQRVLDVGTGTGIVANYAAKLLDNSGSVIGIDLSEGMLKTARLNAKNMGISNVDFLRMDAEDLDLPTESFDSVISMYAIDHFPNAAQALGEMHRVLKPEGHIVISIGSRTPPWGAGRFIAYCVGINRKIKQLFQPHLYAPNFIQSMMNNHLGHLPSPSHSNWGGGKPENSLLRIIQETGFHVKDMLWNHNMITMQSTEEFWRSQTAIVTEVRKRLQNIEPNAKRSFLEDFKKITKKALSHGGRLYYCGAVFMICAIRK
ncbi:MAG: methyltransferase domain-containing protein [Planctomycetes bacterium]|nr:methyltransferase domain-containing protein [Planctomycetota bacterium]